MSRLRTLALATTVAVGTAFAIVAPAKAVPITGQLSITGADVIDYTAHTLTFLPGSVVGATATVTGSFLAQGFDAGDTVVFRGEALAPPLNAIFYPSPALAAGSNLACGPGCIFLADSNGAAPAGNIAGFNITGAYSVTEIAGRSLEISADGIMSLTGFDNTPGHFFFSTQGPGGLPAVTFSATANAVPGPVVGAGLPGLIAACGGLIALARRRRKLA